MPQQTMADLKDLSPLSPRINKATDDLNLQLEAIQNRLNGLALGVEVWLAEKPLATRTVSRDGDRRSVEQKTLGYARHGSGWSLLVRTDSVEQEWSTDQWGTDWSDIDVAEGGEKPLLNAPRDLRFAAVDLIPELFDLLKREAENIIGKAEKAKTIADSIG